jgi:PhoPQ-activated pathogenicity-related protein
LKLIAKNVISLKIENNKMKISKNYGSFWSLNWNPFFQQSCLFYLIEANSHCSKFFFSTLGFYN